MAKPKCDHVWRQVGNTYQVECQLCHRIRFSYNASSYREPFDPVAYAKKLGDIQRAKAKQRGNH